jgi:hypothetical protein
MAGFLFFKKKYGGMIGKLKDFGTADFMPDRERVKYAEDNERYYEGLTGLFEGHPQRHERWRLYSKPQLRY